MAAGRWPPKAHHWPKPRKQQYLVEVMPHLRRVLRLRSRYFNFHSEIRGGNGPRHAGHQYRQLAVPLQLFAARLAILQVLPDGYTLCRARRRYTRVVQITGEAAMDSIARHGSSSRAGCGRVILSAVAGVETCT